MRRDITIPLPTTGARTRESGAALSSRAPAPARAFAAAGMAVAILLTLAAASCPPEPLERQLYKGIATTAHTVDTAMSVAGELYRMGKIDDTQKAKILAAHGKYQRAARAAVAGARAYQSREDVDKVLAQLGVAASEIVALLDSFRRGAP